MTVLAIVLDGSACGDPRLIEWAHRHGIDPDVLPVPSVLTVDPEARTITHECVVLGPDGRPVLDPSDHFARETRVVRLDAPPLPLPHAGSIEA